MSKKKSKTVDIICVVDRSGSMAPLTYDTIGGFNNFLKYQQELPGKANLTLAMFNHEYELVHNRVPVKDVPELTDKTYVAGGMTALFDAIGKTVTEVRATQKKKTPTIMAIFTDGEENSSQEYKDREVIKEMLEELQNKNKWQVHFIGAGIDAFTDAAALGILHANAVAASGTGTKSAYDSYNVSTRTLREDNS